jgi:hypothetical protein
VTCTATGTGVQVTGWTWTGPSYNDPNTILRVTGPTSGNTWKGTAIASGDVQAEATVGGIRLTTPLMASFTVQARTGSAWQWGPNNHWKYTEGVVGSLPYCGSGTMLYWETTVMGWNFRKGTCDDLVLTPEPNSDPNTGYTVKTVSGGPNAGLWYVSALTYQMLTESNINTALPSTSAISYTLVDAIEKSDCAAGAGKTVTKANFYFFNATCRGTDPAGLIAGVRRHEGYGTTVGVSQENGHQIQLEKGASLPEYSLYLIEEEVFGMNEAQTRTFVVNNAKTVVNGLKPIWAAHANWQANWSGSLWHWSPSDFKFLLRDVTT